MVSTMYGRDLCHVYAMHYQSNCTTFFPLGAGRAQGGRGAGVGVGQVQEQTDPTNPTQPTDEVAVSGSLHIRCVVFWATLLIVLIYSM